MMINRQEVAEKLRKSFPLYRDRDIYWAVLGRPPIDMMISNRKQMFSRLADIIDPTCELKIQDGHACCGDCGHRLAGEYEEEEDYWCFHPYCPDCGARVVGDHENA